MTNSRSTRIQLTIAAFLSSAIPIAIARADAPVESTKPISIPAGNLDTALESLARQTGVQLLYDAKTIEGVRTRGVKNARTPQDALTELLQGTALKTQTDPSGAILISSINSSIPSTSVSESPGDSRSRINLAQTIPENAASNAAVAPSSVEEYEPSIKGIPEVLVKGSSSINADIERTEDDMQPYVVFNAEDIRRSQATDVNEFLKTRLPMNTVQATSAQQANISGNRSEINLRGLGANQTLVLVDGRRMPNVNNTNQGFAQPDINGIPAAAIERIEVLPATASGIYGGGATGGVINIITRKDYAGVDLSATYGNAFRGDVGDYRFDGTAGFNIEQGRTHILVTASYQGSDVLLADDRDFIARGRALQFANNPGAFSTLATPPFGYTTNIRNASPNQNVNLQLKQAYGGTPLTANFTSVPVGYSGISSGGVAALVANAGRYNLDASQDANGGLGALFSSPTVRSASVNVRRSFTDTVDVYGDVSWFDNRSEMFISFSPSSVTLPVDAPNNPFTTAVIVRFPNPGLVLPSQAASETLRAMGGAIVRLPHEWTAAADYVWARSRSSYAFTSPALGDPDGTAGPGISATTALQTGVLDVMRDLNAYPLNYSPYQLASPNFVSGPGDTFLGDATLRLSGPVFQLPGGAVTLSGLVGYHKDELADNFQDSVSANAQPSVSFIAKSSQSVQSGYLETRAPLVSAANAVRFVQELELQASVRHDEYETRQARPGAAFLNSRSDPLPPQTDVVNKVQATKYTVGFRYLPVRDLALRASFGTGFLPPTITQLVPSFTQSFTSTLADPKRGGAPGSVTYDRTLFGNPDLKPENSKSGSVGVIVTPRVLPGLRLSVDYINIEKTDEIVQLDAQSILNFEDAFPGRVTRLPLEPNAPAGYTAGSIRAIDAGAVNATGTRLEAYDIQADYSWKTDRVGDFHLYTVATYQPRFERQAAIGTAFVDSAGFATGVLKWRGNAGATWDKGPWTVGWSAQYYDSYFVYAATDSPATIASKTLSQGSGRIPSQTYQDLFVTFRADDAAIGASDLLKGTELTLGIQNVFDKEPPILALTGGNTSVVGGYSTYGDPRLRRFTVVFRKHF